MKVRARAITAIALLLTLLLLTGCFFNVFETARSVGKGRAAITIAMAAMNLFDSAEGWRITPQGRVAVGLTDNLELGLRSGAMVNLSTGDVGFLGAVGDLKVTLFDQPDSFALALGLGGGNSSGTFGWGLEGSVYFDSTIPFLPIYFVYRPLLPLGGGELDLIHQFAGGLYLVLSPNVRLLIEVDSWGGLLSGGIGIEIRF